jgi:hypothetical protein
MLLAIEADWGIVISVTTASALWEPDHEIKPARK